MATAPSPTSRRSQDSGSRFTAWAWRSETTTRTAGVNNTSFGASAAWVDYDKDGELDLFVTNYAKWSEKDDIYCSLDGQNKSYCTPEVYKGDTCRLFHNLGNGRFEDVTQKAGIYDLTG